MAEVEVAVAGAGPCGRSLAEHLMAAKARFRIFGSGPGPRYRDTFAEGHALRLGSLSHGSSNFLKAMLNG